MNKEIPYWLKSQYYVEKIPLYLRENYEQYWLKLFDPLEKIYKELLNFDKSYLDILDYYNKKENKYKPLPLLNKIILQNEEQKKLEWYWQKFKEDKENFDKNVWYNKFYYTSLVHHLSISDLICKNSWNYLLRIFDLKDKMKFVIEKNEITLELDKSKLDELTKIIFKKIINFKFFEVDNIIEKDNVFDKNREFLP